MTRRPGWLAALVWVAASVLIAHAQDGGTKPPVKPLPSLLDDVESRYCARRGEDLMERIARLEVALRLAKAELAVNRRKRK